MKNKKLDFEFYEPEFLEKRNKRTKVITTIGPVTNSVEKIKALYENGMNVCRLNFSHGVQEQHLKTIEFIRTVQKDIKRPVSIMLDTKGPEIRLATNAEGTLKVVAGQEITILSDVTSFNNKKCGAKEFAVSYDMSQDLKPGNQVLVDDGKLRLDVIKVEKEKIFVKAFNSHDIKNNKRINLPGVEFSLPFLGTKDKEDIIFGAKYKVDYIAASFVNSAANVNEIRDILKSNNGEQIQIISKIESKIGLINIDEIIEAGDGIMIARGDLGLEVPYYEVPYWEKRIIRKCRKANKICIVATQMLESMTDNPAPTRAEVTDVYLAAELGADATMLSGESAAGKYPEITTNVMSMIDKRAELAFYGKTYYDLALEMAIRTSSGPEAEIAENLTKKSRDGEYEFAIVASRTGALLKTISKFRPNITILGVCESKENYTKFGVWHSIFMNRVENIDEVFRDEKKLIEIAKHWGAEIGEKVLVARKNKTWEILVK
ncbi:pyruvate kinase [Spiroplasma sp. TIUS-1]|uniref:pyruvate kinase n=1 Tax=Spiroplasma sp. TIUS-1 TaxID=216963 RepID=UPI0013995934|nr:pyruvate kinase [Spiroplasma sp. TIUS-1]QHX36069.1 pyruvate kinase [Spiroplasma sp. TIUS-1]